MYINQDFPSILLTNLFVYFVSAVALFIGNNGTYITTLGIPYKLNACNRPNVFSVGFKPIFNLSHIVIMLRTWVVMYCTVVDHMR